MKTILILIILSCKLLAFNEVEIIALTIAGEARGEGEEGMRAVAAVIINRYNKGNYKSLSEVCLRPYQFSCFEKGKFTQNITKIKQEKSWLIANELALQMVNRIPIKNYVSGANHYHTKQVSPFWRDDSKIVAIIGNHIFYKL